MEEQLVSFETAKLAKELKFDWLTRNYFGQINYESFESHENSLDDYNSTHWVEEGGEWISRPTQSLLQKWLREVHNIDVYPVRNLILVTDKMYSLNLHTFSKVRNKMWVWTDYINSEECTNEIQDKMPIFKSFDTYEEALEVGLLEALKLI